MKLLSAFGGLLIGQPPATIEDFHVRQLTAWIAERNLSFIHPHCTWHISDGHPSPGIYNGRNFYDRYTEQLTNTHQNWNEVVNTVIGSQIGGIVVGNYHFQHSINELWYMAPFTHFYQIQQEQICGVRFFIGDVSPRLHLFYQISNMVSLPNLPSLN